MIRRVAYLSIHTSPLAAPGSGDAGGMNVYIHELAQAMAERGVEVDVFTRSTADGEPDETVVVPGYRVINIAGEEESDLADRVGSYAEGVAKWAARHHATYDVVHSHYWLSGWAGLLLSGLFGAPLAISFHTLGRIKDLTRRLDQPSESLLRIAAETEVISRAACVVASTRAEAEDLIAHYGASPERVCISPPGVDHDLFCPGDQAEARGRLGVGPGPLLAVVGRIQALKGIDVAIEVLTHLDGRLGEARLVVVGGPSGPDGGAELERLHRMASGLGLEDRVLFRGPMPHHELPDLYRAAHALLVPSRSESFGLVAAEAQACGLPVVAARVGGLAHVVAEDRSGILVDGWDATDYAAAVSRVLGPGMVPRLSEGALSHARRFSWPATVDRFLQLYSGMESG